MKLTPKVRKTLDFTIRLVIAILALSYILYRLFTLSAAQLNSFANKVLKSEELIYLATALTLLMALNWGIESMKWKLLIGQAEKLSIGLACQAILGGLAVSIFTPNRIGEFVGRIFILKKTEPLKAILLTIIGSFSQLLVTVIFGTVAYCIAAPAYLPFLLNDSSWLVTGFSYTLITLAVAMMVAYFNIGVLHHISILIPVKYAERVKNSINAIADCPKQLLTKVLLMSALRYIVFTTQFYLAIRLMGLNYTAFQCMMVIPLIYLALAAIPTIALTELGVRGSVSVFLFSALAPDQAYSAGNALAIVSASTLVWLINVAIPAMAGVAVVFRLRFFRK